MSTDTDALIERIARAAATSEGFGPDQPDHEVVVGEYLSDAQFLAPFIAEEVRKAKAEALREMQEHHEREADKAQTIAARGIHLTIADGARTRAAEYETGDSDDHR